MEMIRPHIMAANCRFLKIRSSIQCLFWTYCLIMSMKAASYQRCRGIYVVALTVNVTLLFLAFFAVSRRTWIIWPTAPGYLLSNVCPLLMLVIDSGLLLRYGRQIERRIKTADR